MGRHYQQLISSTIIGMIIGCLFMTASFTMVESRPLQSFVKSLLPTPTLPTNTPPPLRSPSGTPSPTFTSTPTFLTTPTPLPSPTSTSTPTVIEAMILSGDLLFTGMLTPDQQINLYSTSLEFVAKTNEESTRISEAITGLRFSDPSTICGPLTVAIYQSAGLLDPGFSPRRFFLLNPDLDQDRQIISSAFPSDTHTDTRYRVKINNFNWVENPLLPGDFVYLYAGSQGNFEHMLVVTRVDARGRAFSVTNYNTDTGFLIDEVMLYDALDPSAGIFAQWTRKEEQLLGSTGFAGFEVWRRKAPIP